MNRLRSRLIAAFLGVAIMAMVPMAVISYYTLQIRNQKVRNQWLDNTLREVENFLNYQSNISAEVLLPLAQYLQDRFTTSANLLELMELPESLDDPVVREQLNLWEKRLWDEALNNKDIPKGNLMALLAPQILKSSVDTPRKIPQYPIQIIPKITYRHMKEWLDEGLFYEENDKIYCSIVQPILKGTKKDEMEEVGALFCKILFIEKYPDDPSQFPDIYLRIKRYDPQLIAMKPSPTLFEKYLSKDEMARLFGNPPYQGYREVDLDWVRIEANDYTWPQQFRRSPFTIRADADADPTVEDSLTIPLQMKLFPIINHRRELAAVMVLGVPITSIIGQIGYSLLVGYAASLVIIVFAAVLFARTIARPIHELAGAAQQMAEGNFDVRVQEKGTEEHRILGFTFNRLAERIQNQIVQLRQKTDELETSNRELSQTQHFLQNILANIRTGVMSVDREGRISHINAVGESILHVSEWRHKLASEVVACASFRNLITYALRQSISVQENEVPYDCNDGVLIPLQVSIVPVMESGELNGLVVTFHDLSAIRQLEEQIRRQDRLASLGRMAAGVAHEIRNPLGIIRGSAELLRNRFAGQPGEEGLSEFILEEVRRLSRVVNDFLLFARPPEPNLVETPIDYFFEELTVYFTKQPMTANYTLKTECIGSVPPIAADLNLCRQVFLNLFINAQDAMPDGGEIVLRAKVFSEREIAVEVQDRGIGISPERIDKIFDPFYTSKDAGTGLGLSLVHQILTNHRGRIEVESAPGKGSLFRLLFLRYSAFAGQDGV